MKVERLAEEVERRKGRCGIIEVSKNKAERCYEHPRRGPKVIALSVLSLTPFKLCSKCGCTKPATEIFFNRCKDGRYGVRADCRICRQQYKRERYIEKHDEILDYARRYREENKDLLAEKARQRYWENPEKALADDRRWREANREQYLDTTRRRYWANKEKFNQACRDYYERNKEARREYHRQYREENREELKERSRRWAEENYEAHLQRARDYYYLNKEAIAERRKVWAKDNKHILRANHRKRRARKRNAEYEPYTEADINQMWYEQGGCCDYCDTPLFSHYHIDHVIPLSRGGADKLSNLCLACPTCNNRKHAKTGDEFRAILAKELF